MNDFLICIDDTDNLESVGTGELAEQMAKAIDEKNWGESGKVTRHQLFIHEDIAYTSHNSSMCFPAKLKKEYIEEAKLYFIEFLEKNHAEGSDPGLCIVNLSQFSGEEQLIDFGKKAKVQVLQKEDAYGLAEKLGVHLSEHGGTGIGVIGALAGCGLRLSGNDGRFKGKEKLPLGPITVEQLLKHSAIDGVYTLQGEQLPSSETIEIETDVKTVLLKHQSVLLVEKKEEDGQEKWVNISRRKLKDF